MFATLSALIAAELNRAITKRVVYAAVLALALVILLFGVGFGLVAFRDWLSTFTGTAYSNVIVAGGLILIALLVAAAGAIWKNRRPRSMLLPTAAVTLAPTAARLAGRSMTPRWLAIGTVVVAGIWLGRRARNS